MSSTTMLDCEECRCYFLALVVVPYL